MNRDTGTRGTAGVLFVTVVAAVASAPLAAVAGHDTVRTIEFCGFTADGKQYLLLVRDEQMGTFLSLRAFDTGKQVKGYPIESPAEEKRLREEVVKKHKVVDPGVESQSSPDGTYTILGVPRGTRFDLAVMRGNRTAKLHTFRVEQGASGPARVTLKTVFWSKDGRRLVAILHKVLKDENGIDADEAHPFAFFPSSLSFQ